MLNLAAAVERAREFDIIHYEAAYYPMSLAFTRLSPTPIVQTLHHSPSAAEVALWARYPEAPFVAISNEQATLLAGANVVGTVLHGIDTDNFTFCDQPDDYLLFLGRFTEGKGVLQAIEIARRVGMKLVLAAAEDDYYREKVAPHVDGTQILYYGEADFPTKVKLYGGARALLYPVQAREPFGLVLAEAMACGTPVAALDRGAVREVVDDWRHRHGLQRSRSDGRWTSARARSESPARPRAGRRAIRRGAHGQRVPRRLSANRRRTAACLRRPTSPAARSSPSSPIPTTSRSPAAERSPASPTPARGWS